MHLRGARPSAEGQPATERAKVTTTMSELPSAPRMQSSLVCKLPSVQPCLQRPGKMPSKARTTLKVNSAGVFGAPALERLIAL